MTDWKPIDTAPKDRSHVWLWAKPRAHPPEKNSYRRIVGYWHPYPVGAWMAADSDEHLDARYWAPISNAPPEDPEA